MGTTMTSLERVRCAMALKKADVVPVGAFMGNHSAAVAGMTLREYYNSGEKMAEAQMAAHDLYGHDIITVQSDNYYLAEGFGTKTDHHDYETPTFKSGAINEFSEISKLKVPDPATDGRMHVFLEAIEKVAKLTRGEVAIRGCGTGPFSLASHLIGTEKFIYHVSFAEHGIAGYEAQPIFDLMDIATEGLVLFLKAQIKAGAHMVMCGDSLASLDVVSPAIYEKYILPYEQKSFAAIKDYAEQHGANDFLHICGDNTAVLDLYGQTGTDCYEVDYKVDMKLAHKILGDKMCLMGNLDPTGILLQGSVDDVERASLQCIEDAGKDGGFILGSGCEVPLKAPKENLLKMVEVARSYRY